MRIECAFGSRFPGFLATAVGFGVLRAELPSRHQLSLNQKQVAEREQHEGSDAVLGGLPIDPVEPVIGTLLTIESGIWTVADKRGRLSSHYDVDLCRVVGIVACPGVSKPSSGAGV